MSKEIKEIVKVIDEKIRNIGEIDYTKNEKENGFKIIKFPSDEEGKIKLLERYNGKMLFLKDAHSGIDKGILDYRGDSDVFYVKYGEEIEERYHIHDLEGMLIRLDE